MSKKMGFAALMVLFSLIPNSGKVWQSLSQVNHKAHTSTKHIHSAGYAPDPHSTHPGALGKSISAYRQFKVIHAGGRH